MIEASSNKVVRKWSRSEFVDACNEFGDSWGNRFQVKWSDGGNHCDCWGGDYSIEAELPKELDEMYDFLAKHFPQLTYLQVKSIERGVQEETEYEHDYYGGCEHFGTKTMTYDCLLDYLVGFEVLEIISA